MNTTNFVSASGSQRKGDSQKSTFQRSRFNNGQVFTILRFDYVVSEDRKDNEDANGSPVLVLALNGVEFKDKLFIATLYRDDVNVDFNQVPKSGSLNLLVKQIWDNPAYATDDACFAALMPQLAGKQIQAVRKAVPVDPANPNGPKHKVEVFGNIQTLNQLNFNIL